MIWLFHHYFRHVLALPSLVCLLLLAAGLQTGRAVEPLPASACPAQNELAEALSARKDSQLKLKAGLQAFIQGASGTELPLAALFLIDLDDAEKVARRVADLRQQAAGSPPNPSDPMLSCALAEPALRPAALQIMQLQADIAGLRLDFLTMPAEKRAAILHPQIEASLQADTVSQLRQEHISALQEQQQSADALALAERQAMDSDRGGSAELAAQRAELELTRTELTALQLQWVADLEAQAVFYQQTSAKLAEIATLLVKPAPSAQLTDNYARALEIWRRLVDMTPKVVSGHYALALPALPAFPDKLLANMPQNQAAEQYRAAYREIRLLRDALRERIGERLRQSADLHYRVLLQSGEIRSQLLNALLEQGDLKPLQLSEGLFADLKREIVIVPFRWMATAYLGWLDARQQLRQGWEGVIEIALDLAVLLGFIAVPWLIWRAGQWFSGKLNRMRLRFVQRSRAHSKAVQLALALQKMQPYAPWLLMLLALYTVQSLLALTAFTKLSALLAYFRYYIYYRVFILLMQCDFLWLNKQINSGKFSHLRQQINLAARVLGIASLLGFSLLFAIESLIRRGLVYHIAINAFVYLSLLLAVVFAYYWRTIIALALTRFMPGRLGERLAKLCNSHWALLLALPALLILLLRMLMHIVLGGFSHFDFVRHIAAKVFRYQLEGAVDKNPSESRTPLSADYLQSFVLEGVAAEQLQVPALEGLEEIDGLLKSWLSGAGSVRSLAIVGHKGIGKSCLLAYLRKTYPAEQVISLAVPEKLITREQVLAFFAEALHLSEATALSVMTGQDELTRQAQPQTQTILLVDDAHNLFLAAQGGFDGFNTLLTLLTQSSRNVFWCLTFNHFAWNYLNSVHGRRQYFGAVKHLTAWTEQAIQELILGMHKQTEYRLSYDDILQAAGSQSYYEHVAYIENRFFSLLWQQSRGNPRLAVYLWLSALWQVEANALRVGLPEEPDNAVLSELSDDALFVLASIARHENLNLPQLLETTQLPEAAVRQVLEQYQRKKLLTCQDGSIYRLAVLYHYPLIRYLQAKHCLYE